MSLTEDQIKEIVSRIVTGMLHNESGDVSVQLVPLTDGVFTTVDEAVQAARQAYKELSGLSLTKRGELISAMRTTAAKHAEELAEMAVRETGLGNVRDKIAKNRLAVDKTPGIEDLASESVTGDDGLTLIERSPLGVIGSITPTTNPAATIINNSISMIAAGNAVVFNPHPSAKHVSLRAMQLLNQAIEESGGPRNLLTSVQEPTIDTSGQLMNHPNIQALVVTGGGAVVRAAMATGKKVIAAGPGNPPVVVDETADLAQAGRDIVLGASFDNNILCTAEKEVFAVESIADELKQAMIKSGAYELKPHELARLLDIIMIRKDDRSFPNKAYVGKDAAVLLQSIGVQTNSQVKLLIAETPFDHPLVHTEMLMPILPIVRVPNVDAAIDYAVKAEKGNRHTAIMHSQNIRNLTRMAQRIEATIFVKNGPSYAGLGYGGEGITTLTIAGPTGEGMTSARTFTRQRRCILVDGFRIV